ncbi:MAG: prepilin-type N-terminal cleavage/methylation domain-containing protein [Piscinibacter sp.]
MKHHQRGLTLIEALVAFLILSLGMLAVVRLQPELRQHAEAARHRSEATRFAQQDIEALRGLASASLATIVDTDYSIEPDGLGSPRYALQRRVDPAAWPQARGVTVVVSWPDRGGELQQVVLGTLIAASDPSATGALLLAR